MTDKILLPGPKLKGAFTRGQVLVTKDSAAIIKTEMTKDTSIQTAVNDGYIVVEDFNSDKCQVVRDTRNNKVSNTLYDGKKMSWTYFSEFEKPKKEKKNPFNISY